MLKERQQPPMPEGLPKDGTIDAGLLVLSLLSPRGVAWTQEEIAIACGCSRGMIWLIEKQAMEKLRAPVRAGRLLEGKGR